ncbi:MAG: GUN4 domain-containing protein [Microcoleaceae cyanobacterium]
MSYCVNPGCANPSHVETAQYCQSCGAVILLQNRYRPLHPIGQGGFGKTYLAVDEHLPSRPPCVIKQFQFQSQSIDSYNKAAQLFKAEAVRLDELGKHPQIPQLLAHFEQDQQLFLVQEYIAGKTLAQELEATGVFSEFKIWQILQGLLPVLKFIHEHQIIHRDIKPANIMRRSPQAPVLPLPIQDVRVHDNPPNLAEMKTKILEDVEAIQGQAVVRELFSAPPAPSPRSFTSNKNSPMVLIDFGVAKLFTGTMAMQTGTIIGSPEFMAPEQHRGKAFPASDLYSLGVTCLHLMTGVSPWNLYDVVAEKWVWRQFLTGDRSVSSPLEEILDRLVATQLNQRYSSATQVLGALTVPHSQTPKSPAINLLTPPPRKKVSVTQPPASRISTTLGRWIPGLGQHPKDQLISAVGVDYTLLQKFLASRRWKDADTETWAVLCQTLKKSRNQYLHPRELQDLPCEDLRTLDRLWVKYSGGRFGFSVQARIYQKFEGDYGAFCDHIGWLTYNPHNPTDGFKFKLSAPTDHLPSRIWVQTNGKWWQHADIMAAQLIECRMI